ncbi:MAG: hypothetical protein ACK5B9_08465 [Flavobacteriia bacterium]|jgi:hypothetical protein
MKKAFLIFSILLSFSFFGQNYSTAIGIKSGYPGHGSFNIKKFMGPDFAVDILAGTNLGGSSKYFWAQCLFEKNKNIVNTSGFNWYYGAGPALGYWTKGGFTKNNKFYGGLWISADAVVGFEYTASSIPLNIGIEAGPTLNVIPYINFNGMANIFVRYAIQ